MYSYVSGMSKARRQWIRRALELTEGSMRSKLRDEAFRDAARRWCETTGGKVVMPQYASVMRPQHGGAWVEAQIWVEEADAADGADVTERDRGKE